jgi:two-component system, chemotaxis family, chemotaxis protein CheY
MNKFENLKVLIVDDMRSARVILESALVRFGFTKANVVQVDDGQTAIEKLKTDKFDLIISDLNMKHVTGLDLLNHCKGDTTLVGIPFILLSSDTDNEKISNILSLGAAMYLKKPFEETIFLNKLHEIFKEG